MNIEPVESQNKDFYECNSTGSFQISRTQSQNKLSNCVQLQKTTHKIAKNKCKSFKKKQPTKYNKVSQEVKDQFIQQILTEEITLEQAAKSKGITASTAKYLWQKYKNIMLIKRKKRQNNQKLPMSRNLVFHTRELNLKKSLHDYQFNDPKLFFKSFQIVSEQQQQDQILFNDQNSNGLDEENNSMIDFTMINRLLMKCLIDQMLKPFQIDQQSLAYLVLQKILEEAVLQQLANSVVEQQDS